MIMATFKKIRNVLFVIILISCAVGAYRLALFIVFFVIGGVIFILPIFTPIFLVLKDKIESKQIIKEIQAEKSVNNKLEKDFLDAFNTLKDASKSIEIRQQALETIALCAQKGYKPAIKLLEQLQANNKQ